MALPEYITADDVQAMSSSPSLYLRTFDPGKTGAVDSDHLARCITLASSQWNTWMADALPGDWTANGGTVDTIVKHHLVAMVYYFSVDIGLEKNPYQRAFDAARAYAAELKKGRTKLVTATVPVAQPAPSPVTIDTVDDSAASPWVRAAAGSVRSGF